MIGAAAECLDLGRSVLQESDTQFAANIIESDWSVLDQPKMYLTVTPPTLRNRCRSCTEDYFLARDLFRNEVRVKFGFSIDGNYTRLFHPLHLPALCQRFYCCMNFNFYVTLRKTVPTVFKVSVEN